MKRFLSIAMLLAFALCGRAQTQENRTALYGNVSTSLAPGQPGGISAIQLQAVMNNVIASSYNPLSDGTVQPLNANLTSLAGLTYSSLGFVKMSAAGTFALDTNTYLTSSTGVSSITGTSGNITVPPPTGALGTVALTLPGSSGIIALSNNASDVQTIAAGTAYTLTGSNAAVTFGTTSPTVTLQTSLVGATYASAFNSVTYNLYRTNNTPAAIPGTTFSNILNMVALTTQTITGPSESTSVLYTTANTSDIIGVQGLVSATPSAGSATCSAATINAVWLHP